MLFSAMSISEQNCLIVKIPGLFRSCNFFCKFLNISFDYIFASFILYDYLFIHSFIYLCIYLFIYLFAENRTNTLMHLKNFK